MHLLEQYLNRIVEIADLAPRDARRVRGELQCHLSELLDAGERQNRSESEVMKMVEKEFGSPEELGTMIARAKGRFRTYLKKQARRLPLNLAAAVVLAFALKATALEAFRVTTDSVSPRVPAHSRVLVNKLSRHVDANDVIVFRLDADCKVGIVRQVNAGRDTVVVRRNGEPDVSVRNDQIIGKAFFLYSCGL
ncbi:MAG: S24/S26 family peptidase [Sedimentisphaerales bacterium]|nr:S24/S26 family peptidase [Sedimentisphaerales bacterium]